MKNLSKHGIKKSDPRFFFKVENLSKKQIGKSGKSVMYKGEKIPVEKWCREYGRQFYDRECKRDLRDAGVKVFNSFGKSRSKLSLKQIEKLTKQINLI
jgi:hypothetical protein